MKPKQATKSHKGASHLHDMTVREHRDIRIAEAIRDLTPHNRQFSTIAISGYSSSIIGSIIADRMNKHLLIVRKSGVDDHRCEDNEGVHGTNVVFLDDFIDTGETYDRVRKAVEKTGGKLYGSFFFSGAPYIYHGDLKKKRMTKGLNVLNTKSPMELWLHRKYS